MWQVPPILIHTNLTRTLKYAQLLFPCYKGGKKETVNLKVNVHNLLKDIQFRSEPRWSGPNHKPLSYVAFLKKIKEKLSILKLTLTNVK